MEPLSFLAGLALGTTVLGVPPAIVLYRRSLKVPVLATAVSRAMERIETQSESLNGLAELVNGLEQKRGEQVQDLLALRRDLQGLRVDGLKLAGLEDRQQQHAASLMSLAASNEEVTKAVGALTEQETETRRELKTIQESERIAGSNEAKVLEQYQRLENKLDAWTKFVTDTNKELVEVKDQTAKLYGLEAISSEWQNDMVRRQGEQGERLVTLSAGIDELGGDLSAQAEQVAKLSELPALVESVATESRESLAALKAFIVETAERAASRGTVPPVPQPVAVPAGLMARPDLALDLSPGGISDAIDQQRRLQQVFIQRVANRRGDNGGQP